MLIYKVCEGYELAISAQDRLTLKAPNGVAFSEIRGYENKTGDRTKL